MSNLQGYFKSNDDYKEFVQKFTDYDNGQKLFVTEVFIQDLINIVNQVENRNLIFTGLGAVFISYFTYWGCQKTIEYWNIFPLKYNSFTSDLGVQETFPEKTKENERQSSKRFYASSIVSLSTSILSLFLIKKLIKYLF